MKDPVLKFCPVLKSLAIVILAEKDPGTTSPFSSLFDPQSNKHQSFASDCAVLISSISALSPISNLL